MKRNIVVIIVVFVFSFDIALAQNFSFEGSWSGCITNNYDDAMYATITKTGENVYSGSLRFQKKQLVFYGVTVINRLGNGIDLICSISDINGEKKEGIITFRGIFEQPDDLFIYGIGDSKMSIAELIGSCPYLERNDENSISSQQMTQLPQRNARRAPQILTMYYYDDNPYLNVYVKLSGFNEMLYCVNYTGRRITVSGHYRVDAYDRNSNWLTSNDYTFSRLINNDEEIVLSTYWIQGSFFTKISYYAVSKFDIHY